MLYALDCETTGLDLWHGCRPFCVVLLSQKGERITYTWDVCPHTRNVNVCKHDVLELERLIENPDNTFCMHNSKFDVHCLQSIGVLNFSSALYLLERRVFDTHIASHLLHSIGPHGLKELGIKYLDIGTEDEDALRKSVNESRRIAKQHGWQIAKAGHPHFPATNSTTEWWRMDFWLPDELAKAGFRKADAACATYAGMDVERTLKLATIFKSTIKADKQLTRLYQERAALLPITYRMEHDGVTLHSEKLQTEINRHHKLMTFNETQARLKIPVKLQKKNPEVLGEKGLTSTKCLREIFFSADGFGLPSVKKTASNQDSVDAQTIEHLTQVVDSERSKDFLQRLLAFRRHGKSLEYLLSYQRYMDGANRLHSTINICGTRETRQSTSNPNFQNVGKGRTLEDGTKEHNLRTVFGPPPGWCWLSCDYDNKELRIWGYSTGNSELIDCFERGDSVHLLIMEEIWGFADKQADEYRWTKNGDFSIIYGASEHKVDATYKKRGAYRKLVKRFPEVADFSNSKISEATANQIEHGIPFIRTLGDYPLVIPMTEPHKASNYFVQGSAGFIMGRAMRAVSDYLTRDIGFITMQVHDELVFAVQKHKLTHDVVSLLKHHMEQAATSVGIPIPVDINVIDSGCSWSDGVPMNQWFNHGFNKKVKKQRG